MPYKCHAEKAASPAAWDFLRKPLLNKISPCGEKHSSDFVLFTTAPRHRRLLRKIRLKNSRQDSPCKQNCPTEHNSLPAEKSIHNASHYSCVCSANSSEKYLSLQPASSPSPLNTILPRRRKTFIGLRPIHDFASQKPAEKPLLLHFIAKGDGPSTIPRNTNSPISQP